MQTTLLGLALALIAAILAAFAAPFFIDWNEWRPELEAQASALAGSRVTISGKIDLTLLPTPAFVLRDVSVGDAKSGTGMSASEMRGSLALTALLSGKIEADEFVVSRPAIRLVIEKDGKILLPQGASGGQDISVSGFVLEAGSLTLEDRRTNSIIVAEDFSARGELVSREGPFRLDGGFRLNGARWILRASSSRFGPEHSGKARLSLERPIDRISFHAEGLLSLANAAPRFEGKITAAQQGGALPWRITSDAAGDLSGLRFPHLDLALGQGELPITLSGEAKLEPRAGGALELSLSSKRIDLDLGDQKAAASGASHVVPILEELHRLASGFPFAAQISVSADGILAGGQLIRDVRGIFRAQDGALVPEKLEARLPGRATIAFAGKREGDALSGPLSFESEEPQIFVRWLLGEQAAQTQWPAALRIGGLFRYRPDDLQIRDMRATFGGANVSGELGLQRDGSLGKYTLRAKLEAQSVDLDTLVPATRSALDSYRDLNLDLRFKATRAVLLKKPVREASISVARRDGTLALSQFAIDDLDGFSIEGKKEQEKAQDYEFAARATRVSGLQEVLAYVSGNADLPAIVSRYLDGRMPLAISGKLAPLKEGWRATVQSDDAQLAFDIGELKETRQPIDFVMRLPQTEISGKGEFRFSKDGRFEPSLAIALKSSDLRKAFSLVGRASANELPASGSAALRREGDSLVFNDLQFEIDGSRGKGRIAVPAGDVSPFSGHLSLDRAHADALLALALGRAHVSYVELGVPLFANFPGALKVEIETLGVSERLSLQKAAFQIRAGRFETVFDDFQAQLSGGKLTGSLRVADTFPRVLEIRLNAAEVALAPLLRAKAVQGTLRGSLALGSNGNTLDELIANLTGQGALALSNMEISQLDATAVSTVFAALSKETPDEKKIEQMLTTALERAPLKVSKLEAPLVVTGGVIRSGSAIANAGNIEIALSGSFNLRRQSVEALLNIEVAGDSAAKPGASVRWTGPLDAPERKVDARALITAITLRAIERGGQNPSNINLPQEERVAPAKKKRAPAKETEAAPPLPPPADITSPRQPRSQN